MSSDPYRLRTDILDALPADEAPPPPISYPPLRRITQPFPLHPNFWWALLWCFGMLLGTQVLGGIVAIVLLVLVAAVNPQAAPLGEMGKPEQLMQLPAFQFAIGLGLGLAHFLMIVLSLVVLRVLAGRSWARQVAVRRPSLTHVGLVIALVPAFILLANGAYVVTEKIGIPGTSELMKTCAFVAALGLTLLALGLGHLFLSLTFGFDWPQRVWSRSRVGYSAGLLMLFFGMTAALYLGLSAIGMRLFPPPAVPKPSGMEEMMKMIAGWPLPLAVLLIGVMPGFSEELWCRAFLGRGLVGKHGYFWGVLTTSFLFGLIHLDPRQGTMAAVLGVVLHYVYLTTRSLWMPMLLHFLNNSLAVVLSRLPGRIADLEKNAASLPWEVFACGAVLLAAVIWGLYQTRARLITPEGVEPWRPPYPGVACPPPESLTVVHSPRLSPATAVAVFGALAAFVVAFLAGVT